MEIKHQKTKTIQCKPNGRSADFTSANFILGCVNKNTESPACAYCYVARFSRKALYINTNTDEILNQCDIATMHLQWPKVPNQIDDKYYYVDISCDTDINNHWFDYDWVYVFDYFKSHEKLAATFATKWVNSKLLDYEPENKIRVRMSLMPQHMSDLLEFGTSPMLKRIQFLEKLYQAGYSTHINLSPIVYTKTWLKDYKELFNIINNEISDDFRRQCGLECIFLTHNENLHSINLSRGLERAESIMWIPSIQEEKISQYGGNNVRYEHVLKNNLVQEFKNLIDTDLKIPVRYIF